MPNELRFALRLLILASPLTLVASELSVGPWIADGVPGVSDRLPVLVTAGPGSETAQLTVALQGGGTFTALWQGERALQPGGHWVPVVDVPLEPTPGQDLVLTRGPATDPQHSLVRTPQPWLTAKSQLQPVTIDGDLAEHGPLPHLVTGIWFGFGSDAWSGPADCHFRFAISADQDYWYLALDVVDDHVEAVNNQAPWAQDGFELRIDPRPQPRADADTGSERNEVLLIATGPTPDGGQDSLWEPDTLPPDTRVACRRTERGWTAEVAIPLAGLAQHGKQQPLTGLRVNLAVDDQDPQPEAAPPSRKQLWWRPDWRKDFHPRAGLVVLPPPPGA